MSRGKWENRQDTAINTAKQNRTQMCIQMAKDHGKIEHGKTKSS